MEAIKIDTTEDKFIITIDKDSVDADFIYALLDRYRIEQLIKKAEFDEEKLMMLAKEIKVDGWEKNKDKILNKTK